MDASRFIINGKVGLPPLTWQETFIHMEQLIDAAIDGSITSLFIYGTPGTGKTERTLVRARMKGKLRDRDYAMVSGNASAGGLYSVLQHNASRLNIFDDCDDAFLADRTGNILKAALNTRRERVICWPTKNGSESDQSFLFTGSVIFLSNLGKDDIEDAVLSRSRCVEIHMESDDMVEMMEEVLPNMCPDVDQAEKREVLDFLTVPEIREYLEKTSRFDLRTLYKGITDRITFPDWEEKILRFV